jgi:hypothetical protein
MGEQRKEADLRQHAGAPRRLREAVGRPGRVRRVGNLVDHSEVAGQERIPRREYVPVVAVLRDHEIEDRAQGLLA